MESSTVQVELHPSEFRVAHTPLSMH